jgi:chromosome partitioning protein
MMHTKIIAIANQKGGVGKTTTSLSLTSALCSLDKKVLLIDFDPQGNASRGMGVDIGSLEHGTKDVLLNHQSWREVIVSTAVVGGFIAPSNMSLATLENDLAQHPSSSPLKTLHQALQKVIGQYDYILIDCPPSVGFLSLNALTAAHSVIIPVQCEYFAMDAVAQILSNINRIKETENSSLRIEGFLLTMYDVRTRLGTEIASEVRGLFKENTFTTTIPRNISLSEAAAKGAPIHLYRPTSAGAQAYLSLAKELIEHEKN